MRLGVCALALLWAADAHAFCRSTTCPTPASFNPSDSSCLPANWDAECAKLDPPRKVLPLWWRSRCISYDLNVNASKYVALEDVQNAMARASLAWTSRSCPTGGAGTSRVSIDVRDLGPIPCDQKGGKPSTPNQNVIVFRDEAWPYTSLEDRKAGKKSSTIALTTTTYDPATGEIISSDMELNTAEYKLLLQLPDLTTGIYDLESVMTHEFGHFLGIAHSPQQVAVMFFQDEGGTSRHRELTTDDIDAICDVYPPNGRRHVDKSVSASGYVDGDVCDPTPRGGFARECGETPKSCSVARAPREPGTDLTVGALSVVVVIVVVRRAAARRGRSARAAARIDEAAP